MTIENLTTGMLKALQDASYSLNIRPLNVENHIKDQYKMTQTFKKWQTHFKRLMKFHDTKDDETKAAMLLAAIGQDAAALFDKETLVSTEANAYENTIMTLQNLFCVSKPKNQARIRFKRILWKENESVMS